MSEPRYNESLSYAEYLVASRNELDIEAELMDRLQKYGEDTFTQSFRNALRTIDRLAVSDEVENGRKRLSGLAVDPPELQELFRKFERDRTSENDDDLCKLDYLLRSFDSPDAQERADAERLFARIKEMSFPEARDFLATMRPPKGRKGRPAAMPPWRNVHDAMCRMRELMASDMTTLEAARVVADEEEPDLQERERYLAKCYRRKMALRE